MRVSEASTNLQAFANSGKRRCSEWNSIGASHSRHGCLRSRIWVSAHPRRWESTSTASGPRACITRSSSRALAPWSGHSGARGDLRGTWEPSQKGRMIWVDVRDGPLHPSSRQCLVRGLSLQLGFSLKETLNAKQKILNKALADLSNSDCVALGAK